MSRSIKTSRSNTNKVSQQHLTKGIVRTSRWKNKTNEVSKRHVTNGIVSASFMLVQSSGARGDDKGDAVVSKRGKERSKGEKLPNGDGKVGQDDRCSRMGEGG